MRSLSVNWTFSCSTYRFRVVPLLKDFFTISDKSKQSLWFVAYSGLSSLIIDREGEKKGERTVLNYNINNS